MGCTSSTSTAEKLDYLRATPFFLHLSPEELRVFADYFRVRRYPNAFRIFGQNEKGQEFYIVAEGEVDITALDSSQNDQFLCSKKAGDFFGETAVMNEDHARTATVTTTKACTMLVIDRPRFLKYLEQAGNEMQSRLFQIMGERMVTCLKKIEFLADLTEWKLSLLANLFRYETIEAGQMVFEEGDLGRQMYIVSHGEVKVTVKDEEKKDLFLQTLGVGGYFGEIALMVDTPRTATVTATQRCLLLVLGIDDFRNFLHVVPELQEKFEKIVKERTTQLFKKFKVPFFASIPQDRYHELSTMCEIRKYDPGQVIFTEGDQGHEFFLIVHGEVNVIKDEKVVTSLASGTYFGEIALVTDSPRTATITTKSRCVLMSIEKSKFKSFFVDNPLAYADFAIKLSRHDVLLKFVLNHPAGLKYFTEHLASEYSLENLKFWQAAGEFDKMGATASKEELMERAQHIVQTFIAANSEEQVNIPAVFREKILQRMAQDDITRDMFSEARKEILKLMSSDSFKRFKESDRFESLLSDVGSYGDGPVEEDDIKLNIVNPKLSLAHVRNKLSMISRSVILDDD